VATYAGVALRQLSKPYVRVVFRLLQTSAMVLVPTSVRLLVPDPLLEEEEQAIRAKGKASASLIVSPRSTSLASPLPSNATEPDADARRERLEPSVSGLRAHLLDGLEIRKVRTSRA